MMKAVTRGSDSSGQGSLSFYAHYSIEELARQQGVRPVEEFDRILGDFWPNEESAEEFLSTLRRWRQEDTDQPAS